MKPRLAEQRAVIGDTMLQQRWEITDDGRAALVKQPLCITCGAPSDGEFFTLVTLGTIARNLWAPACEQHLSTPTSLVRWWPE